ncbi:MAG TPA: type 4a pilus biogenesis protein PilO [candidate division Zixibacteria bacterium]|nr:type 4a pilus biogenesis protein PilO [candidate division Zixibacteria bacterium]
MATTWKELPALAKIGIVAGVGLVLSVGFYFWKLRPMEQENRQQLETLRIKQAEVAQLAPYRNKLTELNGQISTLRDKLEQQKRIVPEQKEVPAFITVVQDEAIRSGVSIRHYKTKPTVQQNYYVEEPFDVELDGSFFNVVNFFERIAQVDRVVNFSNCSIGGLKGGKGGRYPYQPDETVTMSCTATTFYSTPGVSAPKPVKK